MFVTIDAHAACTVALELAERVERHAVLPRLRGGLAAGPLVRGYGDYYGPIVNTAARAAKFAAPGSVLVTDGPGPGPVPRAVVPTVRRTRSPGLRRVGRLVPA